MFTKTIANPLQSPSSGNGGIVTIMVSTATNPRERERVMADLDNKELKNALSAIEKSFGKGAIMQLGEKSSDEIQGIPTGSISLDLALGGRGLPRGRIVEIFGNESSGKTTLALHAVASAQ